MPAALVDAARTATRDRKRPPGQLDFERMARVVSALKGDHRPRQRIAKSAKFAKSYESGMRMRVGVRRAASRRRLSRMQRAEHRIIPRKGARLLAGA
jgi:hypothetical protein